MLNSEALALFARQHGVATYRQLHQRSVSKRSVHTLVCNGELLRYSGRVLRHAVSPVTFDLRCKAAELEVGHPAVVSYFAAAALRAFDESAPGVAEVTIPSTRRYSTRVAIVHTAGNLVVADVEEIRGIRVTTAARTIIDCAGRCDDRRLAAFVDSAIRDRSTTVDFLLRRASALWYEGKPGSGRLLRVLHSRPGGGLHTVLEREFKVMLDLAGIPVSTQVNLETDGTKMRVDFFVEGTSIVIEVSGHRTHSTRAARTADARRTRASWALGCTTIEFTSDEVFGAPDVTQADLFRIAALLGFRRTRSSARPKST